MEQGNRSATSEAGNCGVVTSETLADPATDDISIVDSTDHSLHMAIRRGW